MNEEYKLLVANNSRDLNKLVNDRLSTGFELYGNPIVFVDSDGITWFGQAVLWQSRED